MKTLSWFCWLLVAFVCLSEAKNKIKRPLSLPYSPIVILRRPRPINHRTSMGNTIYIGGNLSHQRIPYKHSMHRIRRPTMYNALSITWKNQLPIRAPLNNGVNLPQRAPVKDFYSINKLAEYSPEYRPGLVVLPTIHREDIDDDKGPIHTIPAPNLSLAAKPYESLINSEETADRRLMATDYNTTAQNSMTNNFGLATRGNHLSSQETSHSTSHPTLSQHQYEVTESNDVTLKEHRTLNPTVSQSQNLDVAKLYSFLLNNPHQQSDYFLANQPIQSNTDVIQPNVQFVHSNVPPIQTPLHSSLHVGFPSVQTPYTTTQQVPGDLHGHSTLTGPFSAPLSATQLYDLLNTSPHNANQYSSDQQHLLQHQLGQSFQPYLDAAINFPHPQMQSFNYDEQANQLQQQQQQQQQQNQNVLFDRNYVPESAIPDYNLNSAESLMDVQNDVHEELAYPANDMPSEIEFETNIGYDKIHQEETPATYVDKAADKNDISTKFYTVLPNKEAAEKLAVLAAAGNINSYLIDRLRKQEKDVQRNNEIPFNHKDDEDNNNDGGNDDNDNIGNDGDNNNNDDINKQIKDDQQWYNLQKSQQKIQQDHQNQSYKIQNNEPLQITIPDKDTYVTSNDTLQNTESDMDIEYEYENEEEDIKDSAHDAMLFDEKTFSHANSHKEFDSRLR